MAQYDMFLKSSPAPSSQDAHCLWNGTFQPASLDFGYCYTPGRKFDPAGTPDQPVQCVNWCDAHAYCKWAGKRLCGKIGGGNVSKSGVADATQSEWFNACSMGGKLKYSYGNTYDELTCATAGAQPKPAGSYPKCEGGFSGLFDLSGNVAEWESSCDGETGEDDQCELRSLGNAEFSNCSFSFAVTRKTISEYFGMRCCADAVAK